MFLVRNNLSNRFYGRYLVLIHLYRINVSTNWFQTCFKYLFHSCFQYVFQILLLYLGLEISSGWSVLFNLLYLLLFFVNFVLVSFVYLVNKRQIIQKGQSKMDNSEKLATYRANRTEKNQDKNKTQYALDTTIRKQTQIT